MKKIIIFFPSFERGGVELNTINIVKFLKKKKIDVHIVVSKIKEKDKIFFKKYSTIHHAKIINFPLLPSRFSSSLSSIFELKKILKKNNYKDSLIFSIQSSMISILLSKFYGYKIVVRNAADPISSTIYADNLFFSSLIFLLRFIFYNFVDGVITNSKGSAKSLNKFILNKNKIIAIYNPYLNKIMKFKFKKKIQYKKFLSVGRLCKQKNFETLIKGYYEFNKIKKNYKLDIVGSGPRKEKLRHLIKKLGLTKKVKLIPWKKNLKKYYLNSDIFVLTSLYEGLGNVFIDAINNSLPCIYSKCKSGPNEILLNNRGGFPIEIKKNIQLKDKMIYVVQNYKHSLSKTYISHKKLYRFLQMENSKKYFNYFLKIFKS